MTPKARWFWPLLLVLFLTDCATKSLAVEHLDPTPIPHAVVSQYLRFTLVRNPHTAFGFEPRPYLGGFTRPALILAMVAVLVLLASIYRRLSPRARLAAAGLGLACGGAIGNLYDRIRFPVGVVDFIDVGIGAHRFFIFNVADVGINIGAALLALALLRQDMRRESDGSLTEA
jgi:signal peptidase II